MSTVFDKPLAPVAFVPRTEAVISIWKRASEQERALLGQMHRHYEVELARLKHEGVEPQNIAHTIHGLVDESVQHTMATHPKAPDVKCSKACAGCCSLFVNITHEEAVLLVGWCAAEGIAIDWGKVHRQAACDLRQWAKQKAGERRCVFLAADDTCRIYEHRPTTCRKYLVFTQPRYCDTVRHPGHQVGILAPVEGEMIASAALGVLDSGSLPRMLLQAKEEFL